MEVTIANHHGKSFSFIESKKDKAEFKRNVKLSKKSVKKAMSISIGELIQIIRRVCLSRMQPRGNPH